MKMPGFSGIKIAKIAKKTKIAKIAKMAEITENANVAQENRFEPLATILDHFGTILKPFWDH